MLSKKRKMSRVELIRDSLASALSYEEYLSIVESIARTSVSTTRQGQGTRKKTRKRPRPPLTRKHYNSFQAEWATTPGRIRYNRRALEELRKALSELSPARQRYLAARVAWHRCPCVSPCTDQREKSWCYIGRIAGPRRFSCPGAPRHLGFPYRFCNPSTDNPAPRSRGRAPPPRLSVPVL